MRLAVILLATLPTAVIAAGGGTSSAPKPTETTEVCDEGLVWDLATETCLTPEESTNEENAMLDAVRELAHYGRYADALRVLDGLENPNSDLALTYYGFAYRKSGDVPLGMEFYARALAENPDNLLARSYMGQALVESGEVEMAAVQLAQIVKRGGAGTWAEQSLRTAIGTGATFSY